MDDNFVETGPVEVNTDDLALLNLTTKSVNKNLPREDKSVVLTDEHGKSKKTSSIMMGYNKDGVVLGDGNFVSEEDIRRALEEAVEKQESGTIIVNSKGEVLDIRELLELVKKAAGAVIVEGPSSKVRNQDSREWSIRGKNGEVVSKGVAFLGNEGFELKPGVYVSVEELEKALKDYMFATRKGKVTDDETETEELDPKTEGKIVVRVDRKRKTPIAPIIAAAIILVASGLSLEDNVVEAVTQEVVERPGYIQVIDYDIYRQYGIYETAEEAAERMISELQMGDSVKVNDGQAFNVDSLESGQSKTMGHEFKDEGKEEGYYRVSGFSIVVDGEIVEYIEDFDGLDDTTKLQDFINETLKKHNLDKNDIQIKIHLGINGDYTRLGWIDITDLINKETITQDMLEEKIASESVVAGTIENYRGTTIPLPDGSYIVIVDENGNFIKPGSKVIASNGKEYILEDLRISEEERIETETITTYENEVVGKKLIWKLKDTGLIAAMIPALFNIINAINNYRKNKKSEKNPNFFEFATEEQYHEFREEFRKAKEKFEKGSKFKNVMKRIFIGKRVDTMKRLTSEQAESVYASIKRHAGIDFVLGKDDTIKIKEGKIIIYYHDGHFLDITDIVMADIASIGTNNKVEETGFLEREFDDESKTK